MNVDSKGCWTALLSGLAIGDAALMRWENASPGRVGRSRRSGLQRGILPGGYAIASDDTEHAVMTLQALLRSKGDEDVFVSRLAWSLRWWILRLPPSVGANTLQVCGRLLAGVDPRRSGRMSAGNGPLMRAPVIAAFLADDPVRRTAFVRASTLVTNTDPRALAAAHALSEAVAAAWLAPGDHAVQAVRAATAKAAMEKGAGLLAGNALEEWRSLQTMVEGALSSSPVDIARGLPFSREGVSGHAPSSLAAALVLWVRHGGALEPLLDDAALCGGDTDSVGSFAGALSGIVAGPEATAAHPLWRRWVDYPVTKDVLREDLPRQAAAKGEALAMNWAGAPLRNIVLLASELAWLARRSLPGT